MRAAWVRVWRSGGTFERLRVFSLAITAIRTSAFSTTHSEVGETHSSWSSEACSKKALCCSESAIWTIGLPPAFRTSSYTA